MSSNYPPGVTGSEPQITGDAAWETWADTLQPGDLCRVTWQGVTWDARFTAGTDDGSAHVCVCAVGDVWIPVTVCWEDVEPPPEAP